MTVYASGNNKLMSEDFLKAEEEKKRKWEDKKEETRGN